MKLELSDGCYQGNHVLEVLFGSMAGYNVQLQLIGGVAAFDAQLCGVSSDETCFGLRFCAVDDDWMPAGEPYDLAWELIERLHVY